MGARVTCRFHNKGSVAVMVGITLQPENFPASLLTTSAHYMELPTTKTRLLSPDVDHCVLSHRCSVKKHLHLSNVKDNKDLIVDLDGETTPTRTAYYCFWAQPVDQATTNSVDMVVTAEFLILLTDPIIPARSTDT